MSGFRPSTRFAFPRWNNLSRFRNLSVQEREKEKNSPLRRIAGFDARSLSSDRLAASRVRVEERAAGERERERKRERRNSGTRGRDRGSRRDAPPRDSNPGRRACVTSYCITINQRAITASRVVGVGNPDNHFTGQLKVPLVNAKPI